MERRRQVIVLVSLFAAVLLLVPLIWWQYFGPERFEADLQLGVAPEHLTDGGDGLGAVLDDDDLRLDERERAEVELALPEPRELPSLDLSPTTQVTLLFSVGSDGMTREEARRLRVNDLGDRGSDRLTDSIMLLVSDTATRQAALFSLPRDLYLGNRGRRINATFASHGIQALVDDVTRASGLPVHHVVQVNFTAFARLVDAVGGVAIAVPQPMADLYSSLYIPSAGCWRLDGADALAYARSRHSLTSTDGGATWRMAAGANDFTRINRQQGLVSAAWDQVRGSGFVRRIPDLVRLADGMTIDAGLGIDDVVDLARAFSDVAAGRVEGHILPTAPRRIAGAAVLVIDWDRAMPLYARMRSWPPDGDAAPAPADASDPDASDPEASDSDSNGVGTSGAEAGSPPPAGSSARTAAMASAGCSRSQALELADDPQRYLAAIAAGDSPPEYHPGPAMPAEESPDPDADPDADPGADPSSDPDAGPDDPEPTSTPSDASTEPDPEPSQDGGLPSGLPTDDPDG